MTSNLEGLEDREENIDDEEDIGDEDSTSDDLVEAEEEAKPEPPQRPKAVQKQMEKSGRDKDSRHRAPKQSVTVDPIERYSEVDNPSAKSLPRGQEPSRMDDLMGTGELVPYNRKQLIKEYSKMQAWRNAFVAWQAQRDDYVIYQNVGYDSKKGEDNWDPAHYSLYPLTTGQHFRLSAMDAKLNDLKRAATNNDKEVVDVYNEIRKTEMDVLKLKLELYFRMHIGTVDKKTGMTDDPDDEFEKSSWADVRDMIEAAEWAFQWVPRSRRIKPSVDSGSKADQEYLMMQ